MTFRDFASPEARLQSRPPDCRTREPQNRQGAEPRFCAVFVIDEPWCKPVLFHGERGFKLYPKTLVDHGIVNLYREARTPRPEPVTPWSAEQRERIATLYSVVSEQMAE